MAFDAFSSKDQTQTTVTQSWANSLNTAFSSTSATDNSGNTTLNIGADGGSNQNLPLIVSAVAIIAAIMVLKD